jgi:hypothetical protein
VVATRRHRRQNTREARDCSEIDAVKPPVEIRTVCQRLELGGDEVEGAGCVPLAGDFSEGGVGYL